MLSPLQIDIEVSAVCNLRCIGCPFTQEMAKGSTYDRRTGYMDLKLFKSIVDRVDWPCTLVPWLNGEPLMHPDYPEMLKYITDRGHRAYITTNGTIWNEEVFQLITEQNSIYQIIFSLDGIEDSTSQSIELARPGSDRQKILENIQRFGELKARKGNNLDMAMKICRRGQDQAEVEKYISNWLKVSYVDFVCEGRLMTNDANPAGFRTHKCMYSDNMFMVIKYDGTIVPCSYNDAAANGLAFDFGDVRNDTPLLELYNSEAMASFRADQRHGVFRGPCNTCGFAYTGRGWRGIVKFRDPTLDVGPIHYHNDYYNTFYSLVDKREGASWNLDKKDLSFNTDVSDPDGT